MRDWGSRCSNPKPLTVPQNGVFPWDCAHRSRAGGYIQGCLSVLCCCDAFGASQDTTCLRIQEHFAAKELLASPLASAGAGSALRLYFSTLNCTITAGWQKETFYGVSGGGYREFWLL